MFSNGRISHLEGERIVESLRSFNFEDLLSKKWNIQRENVYKLNVESHSLCAEQKDDYILSHCILHSKIQILILELIMIEVWKSKIGLLLKHELVKLNKDSLKPYFINFHECNLSNLLELYFFDKDCYINEEVEPFLSDLVDYCFRKFTFLNSRRKVPLPSSKMESAKKVMEESEKDIYEKQLEDIDFKCCMSALTIFRYLTDNISSLPPNVVHRIISTHDMPISLVYLIEKKPWEKIDDDGKIFRFEGGKWMKIKPSERFRINTCEAQVWLAINNLLQNPETSRKYEYNHHRKETILQLSKYISEVLVDQIPILEGLRKYVTQLKILTPPTVEKESSMLLIEQIAEIREGILKNIDFEEVAKIHRKVLCGETSEERMLEIKRLSEIIGSMDGKTQTPNKSEKKDLLVEEIKIN